MKSDFVTISRKKAALRSSVMALALATLPSLVLAPITVDPALAANNQIRKINNDGKEIRLGLNKSIVIDLPADAYDILVANPGVADAVSRTARRIYVFGKAVGTTNIFVFGPKGEQIASFDLTIERDVAGLDGYLARFVEDSDIKTEIINDNIVLTGTVQTPQDSSRAVALAQAFIKGGEATTGQFSGTSVSSSSNSGGGSTIIFGGREARQESQIVNLLKIVGDDQVTLKVTVAEIQRSVLKQLGVNTLIGGRTGDGIGYQTLSEDVSGLGKFISHMGNGTSIGAVVGQTTLSSAFNAMEQAGVMKTLAEPSLTAVSGQKATFKVGGDYYVLSGHDRENVRNTVTGEIDEVRDSYEHEKIEYGIGLEFLPTVLSPGRINLKIRTSVSEPTVDGSIRQASSNLLAIRKRLADTTVELPSGGSMMIAGLVRDDIRQAVSGMPGLKNVPVLGTLFRSRDFIRSESELVIIVTPYMVRPVARNKLALPTDNFAPTSDGAANFLGKVNRVYGTMQTNLKPGRYNGVVGFIYK